MSSLENMFYILAKFSIIFYWHLQP